MMCYCGLYQNQDSIHSFADSKNRAYAWLSYGFALMCQLDDHPINYEMSGLFYCLDSQMNHSKWTGQRLSAELQWNTITSMFSSGLILVGTLSWNCQFVHSSMGRGALLVIVQPVGLQYMDLGRFSSGIMTEVFNAWCCLQTSANCPVQPNFVHTSIHQKDLAGLF
jgi:hypothetical protein